MNTREQIQRYVDERDAAFENDDIEWARDKLPPGTEDEVVEMTFHKARAACTGISKVKQAESDLWLASRGIGPADLVEDSDWLRDERFPRGWYLIPAALLGVGGYIALAAWVF